MTSFITIIIFFIAAASIALPEFFNIFWVCFTCILIIELIVIKPSRNQMIVFFAVALSFLLELIVERVLFPFESITSAVIFELALSLFVCSLLVYKHEVFGWWLKERDLPTTLAEGVVLKYFKRYLIPIDVLMLLENQIRVFTGYDFNTMYQIYPLLKLMGAAGLFVLLFLLFRNREEPDKLFS